MKQIAEQSPKTHSERPVLIVGWMKYVDLPDLGLHDLKAKIDTGARTSAIHATDITPFKKGNEDWVRFTTRATEGANVSQPASNKGSRNLSETKILASIAPARNQMCRLTIAVHLNVKLSTRKTPFGCQ